MKERPLLKRFVEAVIVNGRVIQEPAKYIKSDERTRENNRESLKNTALLVGSGVIIYLLYKSREAIANGIWTAFVHLLFE